MLKQAGLVQDQRKGQYIYYSLNTTVFQDLVRWLHDLLEVNEKGGENNDGK